MGEYAIRGGEEGSQRLELLAAVMAPGTAALLRDAGIGADMRCVDVGCGAGQVTCAIARRVGAGGQVVGIDIDAHKLERAARDSAAAELANIVFRAGSVLEWDEQQVYDVAYGRFILSHLESPAAVIARMLAALRPGGLIVLEDIDFEGSFCEPANAAYARYCDLYRAVVERRGGDALLGRRLHALCGAQGVTDLQIRVVQPVHAGNERGKSLSLSTLINIADAVRSEGLATSGEIDQLVAELAAFSQDPHSVIGLPRVVQVWGRAPVTGLAIAPR